MPETTDVKQEAKEEPKPEQKEPEQEPVKKYTDAEVDALLDKKFAELSAKLEKKYSDKLTEEKNRLTEAQKLEKMNADEKRKYNEEKLQARIDELEREKSLTEQMTVARKTLKEANISPSDELLSMIVSPDAETTKKAVDAFKTLWTNDLNAAVQDALKRNPPKGEQPAKPGKSDGALAAEKYNAKYQTK